MEALIPFLVLAAVLMLVIPFAPGILDLFVIFSLITGVLIILTTMYVRAPLDFSIFPTVILFTTIYRLFLNVATTRSILSNANAGHVINTFATFVTGSNPVVGLVIFIIIVVINFVVITYGAQRIGEVAARFTLDALPGKQISIDADLNAGIINEEQARQRRRQLEREADYFGAMDGASRFVQRDAMAGIILIIVNIGAGFAVGMLQKGMAAGEALTTFTNLTVGDGLVANIPALLISTATGIMVTKAATDETVGLSVITQLTSQWRALAISAAFLFVISLVPGMPKLFIWSSCAVLGFLAWSQRRSELADQVAGLPEGALPGAAGGPGAPGEPVERLSPEEEARRNLEQLLSVDLLELEIGYGLIPLVDKNQGGDLLERVNNIRKQVAISLGFIVPPMRIRDNIVLKPGEYHVKIKGSVVAKGELMLDRYLAMNPLGADTQIEGIEVQEPAFGLSALWISTEDRTRAETEGFTVVDPATVLATHLTEVIRNNAAELLSRQAVQELIDMIKGKYPAVVSDLVPDKLSVGDIQRVLQLLLSEKVSIRNLPVILETLGDNAGLSKDPEILTEYVRINLGRQIIADYLDDEGKLTVLTVDPRVEERVASSLQQTTTGTIPVLAPKYLRELVGSCTRHVQAAIAKGLTPIFLVSPRVRPYLRKILAKVFPGLVMLSYGEIVGEIDIRTIATIMDPEGTKKEGEE
ncbi:flagellar biosynthesis protein FlhA [bacterium]|nr:flagellar biosynthesis protein FlhA [bacterium]